MKYTFSIPELNCSECAERLEDKLRDNAAIDKFEICTHHHTLEVHTSLSTEELTWYLQQCGIDTCTLLPTHPSALVPLTVAGITAASLFVLDSVGFDSILKNLLSFHSAFILLGLIGGISCCGALISSLLLSLQSIAQSSQKKSYIPLFLLGRSIALVAVCAFLAAFGGHFIGPSIWSSILSALFFVLLIFLGAEISHLVHSDKIISFLHKHIISYQKQQRHLYSFLLLGATSVVLPCEFSALAELFSLQSASWQS